MTDILHNRSEGYDSGKSIGNVISLFLVIGLATLLFPAPAWIVDFGIAFSFALSIVILMVALWIQRPLEFTSFPMLLLIATVFRLALNIATTRLILTHGAEGQNAAGYVVSGVAKLVMAGDFLVGLIVFCIITIVNFTVITKGAGRIAEVGARFTLDSIPGRQMAIDAELSAGSITEVDARLRRRELEEESAFFGAMDGASKFVRGDAIAGLIILVVNLVGGVAIGVLRHQLDVTQAMETYVKLSIGDGLATQIPALVVSLAAGLLVSKGGAHTSAQTAILNQIGRYPQVFGIVGGLLVFCALMPDLPVTPFLLLGGSCFLAASLLRNKSLVGDTHAGVMPAGSATAAAGSSDEKGSSLGVRVLLGRDVASIVFADQDGFTRRVDDLRGKIERDFGLQLPAIEVAEDFAIEPRAYRFVYDGCFLSGGQLRLGEVMLVSASGVAPNFPSVKGTDPAYGYDAFWVPDQFLGTLQAEGHKPIKNVSVILTHLNECLRDNLYALYSYEEFKKAIDIRGSALKRIMEEVVPAHVSSTVIHSVLRGLLAERVPIRALPEIVEAIADIAINLRRIDRIVEQVRIKISPYIYSDYLVEGDLHVLLLSREREEALFRGAIRDEKGEIVDFALPADDLRDFRDVVGPVVRTVLEEQPKSVILVKTEIRQYVRSLVEGVLPYVPVLSNSEIRRPVKLVQRGSI